VDKPAGLPVHPTTRYLKGNLLTLLEKDFGTGSLHLCHRIDRETSGIVLLSRDLDGERFIKRQFSSRRVHKSYLALVKGHPSPAEGLVDAPLRRSPHSSVHTKMEVAVGPAVLSPGKPARTRYRTVDRSRRFALVECFPETGRQHQIRIHMAHLGHPIVGDKIYSVGERVFLEFVKRGFTEALATELLMPRQALHAHRLSFSHPDDGRTVSFTSELAGDIRAVFEADL
jgi:23S rRNA pseudouridine1911/1915/1917 synthase